METPEKPPLVSFRISFAVRLLAVLLVQLAMVWWLPQPGVLGQDRALRGVDRQAVIAAAVVADVSLCILFITTPHRLVASIVNCALFTIFGVSLGCCLIPGVFDVRWGMDFVLITWIFVCWIFACLATRWMGLHAAGDKKSPAAPIRFSLAELLIAMLLFAVAAWLISFLI